MPEIVQSRLARKTPEPSAHPDANLLVAFAERTLLERERAAVVAHLVECAECRECLALACASAEPEMPVAARPSAGAGLGEWVRQWRWILSSAAACCVVATALLRFGEPPARVISVSVSSKADEPQIVNALKSEPAAPAPVTVARKKKAEAPPSNKTETPVLMATRKDGAREDILTQARAPQPPAESALTVSRLEAPRADVASSFAEPERAADVAPQQTPSASTAKRFGAQAALAGRASGFAPRLGLRQVAVSARWSINASPDNAGKRGVVQRSMDGGQSWQVVPLSERVNFRAVATSGPDVWAGGSEGTLFHSPDGGSHWEEIKVASENVNLSGDIVRITARGPNQVAVTTASGEAWTSMDNGKHWVREQ